MVFLSWNDFSDFRPFLERFVVQLNFQIFKNFWLKRKKEFRIFFQQLVRFLNERDLTILVEWGWSVVVWISYKSGYNGYNEWLQRGLQILAQPFSGWIIGFGIRIIRLIIFLFTQLFTWFQNHFQRLKSTLLYY